LSTITTLRVLRGATNESDYISTCTPNGRLLTTKDAEIASGQATKRSVPDFLLRDLVDDYDASRSSRFN
jgi:hypothetical protein